MCLLKATLLIYIFCSGKIFSIASSLAPIVLHCQTKIGDGPDPPANVYNKKFLFLEGVGGGGVNMVNRLSA